jgi:hypothetical protein
MRKRLIRGKPALPEAEPTFNQVLSELPTRVKTKLPASWSVNLTSEPRGSLSASWVAGGPDAELIVRAPDGSRGVVLVEAKRRLDPNLVPVVVDQLRRFGWPDQERAGMVVTSFLSPRTRELLREAGIGYADATGNLRLTLERPALYLETEGTSSDPWAKFGNRPLRSLKGSVAGRIVRALCDFKPPFGVEELTIRSGTSLGSVSRVFALLEREALITRESRGPVKEVKWTDLIRRWTEDYEFGKSNRTRTFLEPRGLSAFLAKLEDAGHRYAITSSLAAAQVAPIAVPRLATVYVADPEGAAERLRLRPAESGANVILAEPFDRVVFDRTWQQDGLTYSALSQVAVDLLTGPGRSPSEGEALLQWMQEHEDAWRR